MAKVPVKKETALVIIHLSSLDSYTAQVEDPSLGELLADAMVEEILNHKGPVYIVDQGWSLGRRESRPRAELLRRIQTTPIHWIHFDEAEDDWDDFEKELVEDLKADGVTDVILGGVWWEPTLESGCVSAAYHRLKEKFKTRINERIVGSEEELEA